MKYTEVKNRKLIDKIVESIKEMKSDLEREVILTSGFNKIDAKEWRKDLESRIKYEEEELKKLITKIK